MTKNCKNCGVVITKENAYMNRGKIRGVCKKCESARSYKNLKAWRRRTKRRAVDYKGGACSVCGYNKCDAAMIFHHPGHKAFGIGNSGRNNWEKIREELDKCVLLCLNCHAEQHFEELIRR